MGVDVVGFGDGEVVVEREGLAPVVAGRVGVAGGVVGVGKAVVGAGLLVPVAGLGARVSAALWWSRACSGSPVAW